MRIIFLFKEIHIASFRFKNVSALQEPNMNNLRRQLIAVNLSFGVNEKLYNKVSPRFSGAGSPFED